MSSVLVVEDKRGMRKMLATALTEEGWSVTTAETGDRALELLGETGYDLVLTDVRLPGKTDGLDVLRKVVDSCMGTPVVLMTAFGTIDMAVSAMKIGAVDFITKPFELDDLLSLLKRCTGHPRNRIVGSSEGLRRAVERSRKAAATGMSVLILGESGTGKELLARLVHEEGPSSDGPFVPVNCAAIPSELMESELFGAEKGAYTGSESLRVGRFEQASGGTIFLDEVGDLSHTLQGKLLRVLQEREFTRLGGERTIKSTARVVAASNRDLETEVGEGGFRKDLYYRLSQFPVKLPPLRDRVSDVPELIRHFLDSVGMEEVELSRDAMGLLKSYSWPGNVRELKNVVLRAAALCEQKLIPAELLEITPQRPPDEPEEGLLEESARVARRRERELIIEALRATGGNRKEAAEMLKVSYRTLLSRIKELKIEVP
ncbi:response regulator [Candidatus Fermentibacteria bacterium]|nr:response regulator [Candidatus Fermentibacteria bacterium]